jgi:hypothetical protein
MRGRIMKGLSGCISALVSGYGAICHFIFFAGGELLVWGEMKKVKSASLPWTVVAGIPNMKVSLDRSQWSSVIDREISRSIPIPELRKFIG